MIPRGKIQLIKALRSINMRPLSTTVNADGVIRITMPLLGLKEAKELVEEAMATGIRAWRTYGARELDPLGTYAGWNIERTE